MIIVLRVLFILSLEVKAVLSYEFGLADFFFTPDLYSALFQNLESRFCKEVSHPLPPKVGILHMNKLFSTVYESSVIRAKACL